MISTYWYDPNLLLAAFVSRTILALVLITRAVWELREMLDNKAFTFLQIGELLSSML